MRALQPQLACQATQCLLRGLWGTVHRDYCSPASGSPQQLGDASSSSRSPEASSSSPEASSSGSSILPWHLQDQILLKGLVFHGYHGALPEENMLGQKFVVDATLWADLAAAGCSDNLQDTIDYSKAYSVIQGIVQGKARALQEAVVEDVCQQLLQLDPRVSAVQVYMRKPHVALAGVLDSVGVQVFRQRRTGAAAAAAPSSSGGSSSAGSSRT